MPANKPNVPKKPIFFYYGIALLIIILLNSFVFPSILEPQITEVDYGTFLDQIENGQIKEVEIENTQIQFTTKDAKNKDVIYVTGRVDDPDLVDKLYEQDVVFSQIIPEEISPFMSLFISLILPMLFFIVVGQFYQLLLNGFGCS